MGVQFPTSMMAHIALTILIINSLLLCVHSQPGQGQGLPPQATGPPGSSDFVPGRPADFRAVGAKIRPEARGKFKAPADTDPVLDSEYIVTFAAATAPALVDEVARQVQVANPGVAFRLLGNQEVGWKGLAYKLPPQPAEQTAALLESLLLLPEAQAAEANVIVRALRPIAVEAEATTAIPQASTAAAAEAAAVPTAPAGATVATPAATPLQPAVWDPATAVTAAAPQEEATLDLPTAAAAAARAITPLQPLPTTVAATATPVDPALPAAAADAAAAAASSKKPAPPSDITVAATSTCTSAPLGTIKSQSLTVSGLWGLDRIDNASRLVENRYRYSSDGTGVNVFVADTGIWASHQEFGGRVRLAFDVFGGDAVDRNGHGTHCAGTIGGATVGVAKNVNLYSVKVLDNSGSGSLTGVINGINFVARQQLSNKILSMSLGGGVSTALNNAVSAASTATYPVLVVVAAGNENQDACNTSPASAASAISVGSSTSTDAKSDFSNWGRCVDIWAPGSSIRSAYYTANNAYATYSGTSMAAPHVAGAAARLLSSRACTTPTSCTNTLVCLATKNILTGFLTGRSSNGNPLLYIPPGL